MCQKHSIKPLSAPSVKLPGAKFFCYIFLLHLLEERIGQRVSKMHLYYTGEDDGGPTITYSYTRSAPERSAPEGTMTAFDDTIKRIMKRDFHRFADDPEVCAGCDFRFYCKNK